MTDLEIQAQTMTLVRRTLYPMEKVVTLQGQLERLQAELDGYKESANAALQELREHLNATSGSAVHDELVRERGVRAASQQECQTLRQQLQDLEPLVALTNDSEPDLTVVTMKQDLETCKARCNELVKENKDLKRQLRDQVAGGEDLMRQYMKREQHLLAICHDRDAYFRENQSLKADHEKLIEATGHQGKQLETAMAECEYYRRNVERLQTEIQQERTMSPTALSALRTELVNTNKGNERLKKELESFKTLQQECETLRQQLSTYEGLVLRLQQSSDEAYHIVGDFLDSLENKKVKIHD
jgi:chromosome segregation ATPase